VRDPRSFRRRVRTHADRLLVLSFSCTCPRLFRSRFIQRTSPKSSRNKRLFCSCSNSSSCVIHAVLESGRCVCSRSSARSLVFSSFFLLRAHRTAPQMRAVFHHQQPTSSQLRAHLFKPTPLSTTSPKLVWCCDAAPLVCVRTWARLPLTGAVIPLVSVGTRV
jgi:hypothetical protein